jgi:hypothetical protein
VVKMIFKKGTVGRAVMISAVGLTMGGFSAFPLSASAESQSQHLAMCKSELKSLYGADVRERMVKAKSYQGKHKMTLKVYPAGEANTVIECFSNEAAEQSVVLRTKDGTVLNP